MRLNLIIFLLITAFKAYSQNQPYELIKNCSHSVAMVGDDIEFSFYAKNNSNSKIVVPGMKSSARGIDDVLTHKFEIFNETGTRINKVWRCGIGGKDRRILSGIVVKPGDSVLLVKKTFQANVAGVYKVNYLFDFHPNNGLKPNPSPETYKKMFFQESFFLEVKKLDFNFEVKKIRITSEELWVAPIYKSLGEAKKNPSKVYRLHLKDPTQEGIGQLSKFSNLQDLSLQGGSVDSLPYDLFELNFRSLNLGINVKKGINFPKAIQNSKGLEILSVRASSQLNLSGFEGGVFSDLKTVSINASYAPPLKIIFPVETMISIERISITAKIIDALPSDFSNCRSLTQFHVSAKRIDYPNELILPYVQNIALSGNITNILPNLSKCEKLEQLHLLKAKITELPTNVLQIPNLKEIYIKKEIEKNEVIKQLKKRGVEIIKR